MSMIAMLTHQECSHIKKTSDTASRRLSLVAMALNRLPVSTSLCILRLLILTNEQKILAGDRKIRPKTVQRKPRGSQLYLVFTYLHGQQVRLLTVLCWLCFGLTWGQCDQLSNHSSFGSFIFSSLFCLCATERNLFSVFPSSLHTWTSWTAKACKIVCFQRSICAKNCLLKKQLR